MLPPSFSQGCQVEPSRIKYDDLKEWLSYCQRLHPNTCGLRDDARSASVRCIDCLTRELVQIDAQDKYFALILRVGSSFIRIPRVTEDALIVVKRLGQRHLWVDKYCIDQHDSDVRHYQIRNMDHIYE